MLLPTQDKEARLTDAEITKAFGYPKGFKHSYMAAGLRVVNAQIARLEKLGYHKGLPSSIEEALNSGDGVYRP